MGADIAADIGKIPKPVLRGLHNATIKKNLIVSGVLMVISVIGVKYLYNEPKKNDYAEFYKTYDAEKSFRRMVDAGLLQSVTEND